MNDRRRVDVLCRGTDCGLFGGGSLALLMTILSFALLLVEAFLFAAYSLFLLLLEAVSFLSTTLLSGSLVPCGPLGESLGEFLGGSISGFLFRSSLLPHFLVWDSGVDGIVRVGMAVWRGGGDWSRHPVLIARFASVWLLLGWASWCL